MTSGDSFNVARGDVTDRVRALSATAEFFKAIGVHPTEGRAFAPEECLTGARPVAVISHGLWQRAFGGSSDAIGAVLALNDRPVEVIGVMPAGFVYQPAVDILLPLQLRVDPRDRGRNYTVIGRLKPGVTLAAAQAETDRLVSEFHPENPQHLPKDLRTVGVIRYQDFLVADLQPLLLVILGAVRWSCSSPAGTSPICCCRARPRASAMSPSGRRSAPAVPGSSGACSRRA